MQIFVKNVTGDSKFHPLPASLGTPADAYLAVALAVPTDLTVQNLVTLISLRTSLPEEDLRLVYAGKHLSLSPTETLASLNITRDSTIHLALPLRGGMAKKIRCTYKDCKGAAQGIIGDCGFCNGTFCGKHRLLEDHKCTGLENVSSFMRSDSGCCPRYGSWGSEGLEEEQPKWWLIGLTTLDEGFWADILSHAVQEGEP
jgi:hypothetical protein